VALAGEGEGGAEAGGAGPYDSYVEILRHGSLNPASRNPRTTGEEKAM
jgi:hypothetical protein